MPEWFRLSSTVEPVAGIAIKSHGGTDALGFASAVNLGYQMADSDLVERMTSDIEAISGRLDVAGEDAAGE